MKNKYIYNKVSEFINSKIFVGLVFYILIFSVVTCITHSEYDKFSAMAYSMTNFLYLGLSIFPVITFLTIKSKEVFQKESIVVIRFKNKAEFKKVLIKYLMIVITIIYLVILVSLLIGVNIVNYNSYQIVFNEEFGVASVYYFIYIFVRTYLVCLLYSIINLLLLDLIENKILILFNGILYALIFTGGYRTITISSIKDIPIICTDILLNSTIYDSFLINVEINALLFLVFIILITILYHVSIKRRKDLG